MSKFTRVFVVAATLCAVTAVRAEAPKPAPAAAYTIDPVHSTVLFKVLHMGASNFYGRFNDVSGTIALDVAKPENSSVEFTVKTESIDTNNAKRDEHLKGPDFFLTKQFPTANFKSKTVKKTGDKTYDVAGDLTIRGITKPASFTFTQVGAGKTPNGKEIIGGETAITVKRGDFGLTYGQGALGEEVTLIVSVEAGKN